MRIAIRVALGCLAAAALFTYANPPEDVVVIPVAGVTKSQLRSDFHEIHNGHRHNAIDIRAPRGTAVLAAVDGTIRKLFNSRAGGLTIYEFDVPREKSYYYAHLDRYAANIVEGLRVRQGDVIGYVGTTGNAPPETPHLHFAIAVLPPDKAWSKGEPFDPYPLLMSRGVTR